MLLLTSMQAIQTYFLITLVVEHGSRCVSMIACSARTSKIQVDGPHQRPVASVSQRGDDQAATVPKVLVAIQCNSIDHFDNKSIAWGHAAWWGLVMLPVVSTSTLWS